MGFTRETHMPAVKLHACDGNVKHTSIIESPLLNVKCTSEGLWHFKCNLIIDIKVEGQ